MDCIVNGILLTDDAGDRIKKQLLRAVPNSMKERIIIAGKINKGQFQDWAIRNVPTFKKQIDNGKTVNTMDGNVLYGAIRKYTKEIFPNITNTESIVNAVPLENFTCESAKKLALDHTGNIIRKVHKEQLEKPESERLNLSEELIEVCNRIKKDWRERVNGFINYLKENNKAVEDIAHIEQLQQERDRINVETKALLAEKRTKEIIKKIKENQNLISDYNSKLDAAREVLVDKYAKSNYEGYIQLINFTALNNKVRNNTSTGNSRKTWLEEALGISRILAYAKEYKQALESEKLNREDSEDEYSSDNSGADNINQMTKSWEDSLAKSYKNLYSTKLKMYLDDLYDLAFPVGSINAEESEAYETDNYLGVPISKGSDFYLNQIASNGNWSSVDALIESLERKANNIPELYSLSILVKEMKENREWANYVFAQTKKPMIKKAIVDISSNGFALTWSNEEITAGSAYYFRLYQTLKNTYRYEHRKNSLEKLRTYRKSLNNKTNDAFIKGVSRLEIYDFITDYIQRYFPSIEKQSIDEWLYTNNKETLQNYKDVLGALETLEENINQFIKIQEESDAKTNKAFVDYYRNEEINAQLEAEGIKVNHLAKPNYTFEENEYNRKCGVALQRLTGIIINHVSPRIELNHANGENKLASDLIKNSYITNILEKIKTGATTTKEGLRQLYNAVTKSDQYKSNPILFGVRDFKGNVVVEGLFTETTKGTYEINPDAENILDFVLFDGIRNQETGNGTVYQRMSKADYFITNLIAYGNTFSYDKRGRAGFFTRIPSDAGKTFIAETIRYSTKNLFIQNDAAISGFKTQLYDEIIDKNKDYIDNNIKEEERKKITADLRGYSSNFITPEFALNILKNGFNGTLNTANYKKIDNLDGTRSVRFIVPKITYDNKGKRIEVPSFVIFVKGERTSGYNIDNIHIESIKSLNKDKSFDLLKDYTYAADEIKELINNDNNKDLINYLAQNQGIKIHSINRDNQFYYALYNQILGEIRTYVSQLSNVFEYDEVNNRYITKTDTKNLFDTAHYKDSIVKNGRLTGGFFKFKKLFDCNGSENRDKNYAKLIEDALSLYGGSQPLFKSIKEDKTEYLVINNERLNQNNSFIKSKKQQGDNILFDFVVTDELRNQLCNIIDNWINDYKQDAHKLYNQYRDILPDNIIANFENRYDSSIVESFRGEELVTDFLFNSVVTNMAFDDILEGSTSFYKDPQTFLKRTKEIQMSGDSFATYDILEDPYQEIKNITRKVIKDGKTSSINEETIPILVKQNINGTIGLQQYIVPTFENGIISKKPMVARNGFRAIAIKNTVRPYDKAEELYEQVYQETLAKVNDINIAKNIANGIADGFRQLTKTNDAQSYITLDEFIRRRYADGTLSDYQDILQQLLDPNIELKDLDFEKINSRIQVQKNVYYDINYDYNTHTYYPRQVKNAEFVLVPKLLPKKIGKDGKPEKNDLEKLYDFMVANDIGQINTEETLKAGKKNVLTLWDNNGNANFEQFIKDANDKNVVENFYYQYLYKQQEVPEHMKDQANKAGIQIMKKIQDNLSTASPKVKKAVNNLQKAYVANIKSSFDKLIFKLGFAIDDDGTLINRNYRTADDAGNPLTKEQINASKHDLNFSEFWKRARVEAQRLNMSSNFIDYLTPNELGVPEMPNWYNIASVKLESIAQSIFNSMIARQTLPGWHAAQITNVGYSRKLRYHPDTVDEKGNVTHHGYMEVLLPRWSKLLPQRPKDSNLTQEQWDKQLLKQLEEKGLDIHLGYRIPTEGKQSISVLKVVGFLDDAYGSTIVVSDEWVTQTGSDFDVDSVYGITKEFYQKDGKFYEIKPDLDETEDGYRRRYIAYVNELLKNRKKTDADYAEQNEILSIINDKILNYNTNLKYARNIGKCHANINEITSKPENAIINNVIKDARTKAKRVKLNTEDTLHYITRALKIKFNDKQFNDVKEDLNKVIENFEIINNLNDIRTVSNSELAELKTKELKELRDEAFKEYFENVKNAAKELHIVSFEDFKKLPLEEQQSQKTRNNIIVNAMIDIMLDPTTLEENLSRSNFDDIGIKKELEELAGVSMNAMSPYNPITQFQFFENAINGRKLKAFSVDRDTFVSVCNKIHARLQDDKSIEVHYDLTEKKKDKDGNELNEYVYDAVLLKKSYGKDCEISEDGKTAIVRHNRLGWSETNRNVVGKLLTCYSSETTAHILDAIKMGAIYNETDYTFGTFKTLVDLGIDYETAIAFLMQPAITTINNYNFQKNSIYTNNINNPIKNTIKEIAKKLNIKVDGKVVSEFTDYNKVLEAFIKDESFMSEFARITRIDDQKSLKNITGIQLYLDKKLLRYRLEMKQSTEYYEKSDGTIDYEKGAIDIAVALMFNNFYTTTKGIETAMRMSNPDSFGARQTIHETRRKVEDILAVIKNPDNIVNNTLYIEQNNGKSISLIQSLYPGLEDGSPSQIKEYESSYPYLAAIFKYCTSKSVEINKNIFKLETDPFYDTIKRVEQILGIKFTEEQYSDFKKYIVNNVYRNIPILTMPITLNEHNYLVPDQEMVEENSHYDYWHDEVSRVYGYYEETDGKLEVKDINNPSKDELKIFRRFTPVQKVLFIQKNFQVDNKLYQYIKAGKYYNKEKGYNTNFIRFNDTSDNIEHIIKEFGSAFFNTNSFIRLATMDLIKYAFIVEGFNFKKGSISKIVKNECILKDRKNNGTGIVSVSQRYINVLMDINSFAKGKYLDNYVRSHPEVIQEISFKRTRGSLEETNEILNGLTDKTGLVFIPFTETYNDLLKKLNISAKDKLKGFVRVGAYPSSTGGKQYTLYKLHNVDAGVYLIPLNTLEKNEIGDVSANPRNNVYLPYSFYQKIVEDASPETETILSQRTTDDFKVYTTLLNDAKKYEIPKLNTNNINNRVSEPNLLIDLLKDSKSELTSYNRDMLNKFMEDINKKQHYLSEGYELIWSESKILAGLIKEGNDKLYQNIIINNKPQLVEITRFKKTKQDKSSQIEELDKEASEAGLTRYPIFKVKFVTNEIIKEEFTKDAIESINETFEDNPSMIDGISSEDIFGQTELNTNEFGDIERVGEAILNDIYFDSRKGTNQKDATTLINRMKYRGVNRHSLKSIRENKKSVYISAATYYKDLADSIINQLNEFKIDDKTYKINDKELYNKIRNNPEAVAKLVKFLLDAKTFGNTLQTIFGLDISSEDLETQKAIESIKSSITKVRDSNLVHSAYDLIFDIYLAQLYSNNPNLRFGISKVTDTWRDANFFEHNISDIKDFNNKQIQIIVKAINNIINTSRFDAIENQEQFRKKYKELTDGKSINIDNIIDKDGRFIKPYTDKFIEDKEKLNNAVRLAELKYQDAARKENVDEIYNSIIELEKAKLARDEWRLKNVEQIVVSDYYKFDNANRRKILREAPKEFAKYIYLQQKLYNDYANIRVLTESEKEERYRTIIKIRELRSDTLSDGTEKNNEQKEKSIALNEYIQTKNKLNKTYFNRNETKEFKKTLTHCLDIINNYNKEHPDYSIVKKLENKEYADAYYWIQQNTTRVITESIREQINTAFNNIKNRTELNTKNPKNPFNKIYSKIESNKKYDAFGIINGLGFEEYVENHPDDDIIQQLHDIMAENYNPLSYENDHEKRENYISDNNLIKDIPEDVPTMNDKFYSEFKGEQLADPEDIGAKRTIMAKINNLIKFGINPDTGHISSELLFKNLTTEQLNELADLYDDLRAINKSLYLNIDKFSVKGKDQKVKKYTNNTQFNKEFAWYENNINGNANQRLWIRIFCEVDENGIAKTTKGGKFIPNRAIYGWIGLKMVKINGEWTYDPTYIDKKKTNAKKFLKDNIKFVPTEYYYEAIRKHTELGDYEEWYKKNHVYNPYSHKFEPLRIWTTMEINPELGGKNGIYEFIPSFDNTEKEVKSGGTVEVYDEENDRIIEKELPDYRNKNYREHSVNYNTTTGEYRNDKYTKLNKDERNLLEFLQNTLNETASSNEMKHFFDKGFIPRRYRPVIDGKFVATELFGAVGLEVGNNRNVNWHDNISYEKDFDADFDMARIIPVKGYEEYEDIPKQQEGQSDIDYNNEVQIIKKENAEREKRNLERECAYRDNNIEKIFEDYIGRITEYKAKQKSKDLFYLLLEDLKSRESYDISPFGKLKTKSSPVEEKQYQTRRQTNTIALYENWGRRILFDEYKKRSPYRPFADLMQNITSAKYMIFNVTGGISNITTGLVNIMGEVFAGQYFSSADFRAAQAQYFSNAIGFIASIYDDKSPNMTISLAKRYSVVDFDAMVERKPGESIAEWSQRARNLLYGLQSSGEHYMQNSVLFAVLKSHRIFKDIYGKTIVGNFNDYTINVNHAALQEVIKDDIDFMNKYNLMLKQVRKDKDLQREYDMFQRDFCVDFIKSITEKSTRDKIAKSYNAKRKELLKNAKEEFDKELKVEDQYEFKDGYAKIKANSPFTTEMEGFIKNRVQTINTKIHGVYDKIGAAKIESEWWGGLVMQYHKHIYPGMMKRFRTQGYFNETRGTVEKGSYISFWNLLTKDFTDIKSRINDRKNDGANVVIASLQEVAKSAINCVLNIGFNYSVAPTYEQQNIKRVLGDLLGITSAIVAAFAIYMLTDDDDREESDVINLGIYLADRLFSESQMYTPWGLFAEARTMWSSPIAMMNGPEDLLKALSYIGKMIVDKDFDPTYKTGLYAGQNKLSVLLLRNVPFVRVIERLQNMSENNSYYRIDSSSFNIGIAANIAAHLKGEVNE